MRKFGKILAAALVAGSALGVAVPAQAQYYPQQRERDNDDRYDRGDRYDHNDRHDRYGSGEARAIRAQIDQLQQRVERNDGRDRISEREAAALRRAVYNLRQQFHDFSRNGLSQRETQYLRSRIQQIRSRLQYERRDDDGRRW